MKLFKLASIALIIGIITGICNFIFGTILLEVVELNYKLFPFNIIALPFMGLFIVHVYQKYGGDSNKGFKVVFDAMDSESDSIPIHHGPLMIATTWLGHLVGGSVGREGVAVQMGATVADNLQRIQLFTFDQKLRRNIIAAGKASGFAALFGTPIAGIFFAYELSKAKVRDFSFWFVTVIAAFTGNFVTTTLKLPHFHVHIEQPQFDFSLILLIKLIILGIVFSLGGTLFITMLKTLKSKMVKILPNPYKRVFYGGIILAILLIVLHAGRYTSLGTNLIDMAFDNPDQILVYDFFLKTLVTTLTLCLGFQGGEVTPIFSIGATLGVIIGSLLGLPVLLCAALGYACVFGAATNTYLASLFICLEIFGTGVLLPLIIVMGITYLFRSKISIYPVDLYQ